MSTVCTVLFTIIWCLIWKLEYFTPNKHIICFRTHHRDLKDSYDRLNRIASKGPKSQDFVEPKVQGLWRMAMHSNFTADELSSLKVIKTYFSTELFSRLNFIIKFYIKLWFSDWVAPLWKPIVKAASSSSGSSLGPRALRWQESDWTQEWRWRINGSNN